VFNNGVTYDKKWDTKENIEALNKLSKKFFSRSIAYPDCPIGWAPEVLELLVSLDKELGIMHNTSTEKSVFFSTNFLKYFVITPLTNIFFLKKNNFKKQPLLKTLSKVFMSLYYPYRNGFRVIKLAYINALLNKIKKPKITLFQIKEKYGYLTIYFSAPEAYTSYIKKEIAKCEAKLAKKGCYYPIESLWNHTMSHNCGTKNNPEMFYLNEDKYGNTIVSITTHREAITELGYEYNDINLKAGSVKDLSDE